MTFLVFLGALVVLETILARAQRRDRRTVPGKPVVSLLKEEPWEPKPAGDAAMTSDIVSLLTAVQKEAVPTQAESRSQETRGKL